MSQSTVWLDLTSSLAWVAKRRPPVGIIRAELRLAQYYLERPCEGARFCCFEGHQYRELTQDEVVATIEVICGVRPRESTRSPAYIKRFVFRKVRRARERARDELLKPALAGLRHGTVRGLRTLARIVSPAKRLLFPLRSLATLSKRSLKGAVAWGAARLAPETRLRLRPMIEQYRVARQALDEQIAWTIGAVKPKRWQLRKLRSAIPIAPRPLPNPFREGDVYLTVGFDWEDKSWAMIAQMKAEVGLRVVSMCYDLIPLRYPEWYGGQMERLARHFFRMAQVADHVMCISECTRRDLVELLAETGVRVPSTSVVQLGCDSVVAPSSVASHPEIRRLMEQKSRYVLYVSTLEVRKNHHVLLDALEQLRQQKSSGYPLLVFVGMRGWQHEKIAERVGSDAFLQRQVRLVIDASDADLSLLYQHCEFTVYPSLYEGWGLPVAESLEWGKCCIAAHTSSIPEVGGGLVEYLEPADVTGWAQAIDRYWTDGERRIQQQNEIVQTFQPRRWEEFSHEVHSLCLQPNELLVRQDQSIANPPHRSAFRAVAAELAQIAAEVESELHRAVTRQLLVDVTNIAEMDARTGIQRVVRGILIGLLRSPPAGYRIEPYWVHEGECLYLPRVAAELTGYHAEGNEGERVVVQPGDHVLGLGSFDLPLLSPIVSDELKEMRRRGATIDFVVYDTLPLDFPESFQSGMVRFYTRWLSVVARHGDGLVCISHAVADDVLRQLHHRQLPRHGTLSLRYFHCGADLAGSAPTMGMSDAIESFLAKTAPEQNFLTVSTIEPRKCHEQMLEAFEQLWERGHEVNLVIVGRKGWNVEPLAQRLLQHPMQGRRLFWFNGVSDQGLAAIYGACRVLIAASKAEGFGLPLIEAAVHGLALICRDIPVFREVAGDHAFYFTGNQGEQLAASMEEWIALNERGSAPPSRGLRWLTWQQSADQLADVVLSGRACHRLVVGADNRLELSVASQTDEAPSRAA